MGSVSSLLKERLASVGLPLMSLMPKISESGKEAETKTFKLGEVLGVSTSSSGICILSEGEFTGELWISYCLIRLAEQLAIRAGGLETED